jgi:hypothetical protein
MCVCVQKSGRHREPLAEMLPLVKLDGRSISAHELMGGGGGNKSIATSLSMEHLIAAAAEV